MRIAALYDIHGNLPALEAVLDALLRERPDEIIVGGDVVPGPLPAECLARLDELGIPTHFIRGNGENDLLTLARGEEPTRVPEPYRPALSWCLQRLSAEALDGLKSWPVKWRTTHPSLGRVLFCHATPRDDNELFTRVTPEQRLRPVFDDCGADVVVCGHTHMPFDRRVGDVRIVNAGSVGMPFGEPGACWLLLADDGIHLRRAVYDYAGAEQTIAATGFPIEISLADPPAEAQMLELFEASVLGGDGEAAP